MGDSPNFSKKLSIRQSYVYFCQLTSEKINWREIREENALGLELLLWDYSVDNEATRLQSSCTGATE